jgi:23S rRNA (adenine2503-C2)-methyltransferase
MLQLFGRTVDELVEYVRSKGLPAFAGRQLAEWLYRKNAATLDEITNLSKSARALLSADSEVGVYPPEQVQCSADGTKKYLYRLASGAAVEAVYIPEAARNTLCVSTQAGCGMGCRFCMTARQGLRGNLSAGEILNQFRSLPERDALTNLVFMGMGEPLDNVDATLQALDVLTAEYGYGWGHKRITVSTVGASGLERFLAESRCRLAVSIHSPFDGERQQLMPAQKLYPIAATLRLLENDPCPQRRVSFEYILFAGINDTLRHADALVKLLARRECRVNLLRFHRIPDSPLAPSDEATVERFRERLNRRGLPATVRESRGEDIAAACGMLSTKKS